jgi:hypothetical protein
MQSRTLSAPWRKLLLTIHVVATVSVLGTDLVLLKTSECSSCFSS